MEGQVERKALARAKKWSVSSSALRLAASSSGSCPAPLRAKLRFLSGFAAASLIALLLATAAWAQISPGPLSRAHQSLSGPTQCTSCHKVGTGKPDLKCLECHVEIAQRLAEQRGLRSEEHTSELQSLAYLVCRLLLEKKKKKKKHKL